jgi:stress response protein SCP2
MAVSLVKGGNVSLTKEAPSMNVALVGLGWDARVTDGQAFDLDASVFLVGEDGKVLSDSHFVFITTPPARTARSSIRVTTVPAKATAMMNRSKSNWLKSALTLKTGVCCHYS